VHELDVGREVLPHATRHADLDSTWVDDCKVVEGEHAVTDKMSVITDAQNRRTSTNLALSSTRTAAR
jgi:hypothetical protein